MRPSLTSSDFLNNYQQKPKPGFSSSQTGPGREFKLSYQASHTFNAIRTPAIAAVGYRESRYINRLDAESQDSLFRAPVCAIVRNLAVPVEAATSNRLLQFSGYNSAKDFLSRHNQAVEWHEQTAS